MTSNDEGRDKLQQERHRWISTDGRKHSFIPSASVKEETCSESRIRDTQKSVTSEKSGGRTICGGVQIEVEDLLT